MIYYPYHSYVHALSCFQDSDWIDYNGVDEKT